MVSLNAAFNLEYMGSFFYMSTLLGVIFGCAGSGIGVNGYFAFWASGLGAVCGTLVEGSDFNPATSLAKFLLNDKRSVMELLVRWLGQFAGMFSAGLGTWAMTGDLGRSLFLANKLNQSENWSIANQLCQTILCVGPGIWLLDQYKNRKLGHFIVYGYQAWFSFGYNGGHFNWMRVLVSGICATIQNDIDYDSSKFWAAFGVIVAGGLIAPFGTYVMVKYSWPRVAGFVEEWKAEQEGKDAPENNAEPDNQSNL